MKDRIGTLLLGVALGVLITMAWTHRYYVAVPNGTKACYKLDKWTGNITFIYGNKQTPVVESSE